MLFAAGLQLKRVIAHKNRHLYAAANSVGNGYVHYLCQDHHKILFQEIMIFKGNLVNKIFPIIEIFKKVSILTQTHLMGVFIVNKLYI